MNKTALLIGNSDGIGLALTHLLLKKKYKVIGLSRRNLEIHSPEYKHIIQDVTEESYGECLSQTLKSIDKLDLFVYLAGIGGPFNPEDFSFETKVFQVNLMSAVIATELCLTKMQKQNHGHFIGLSSVSDALFSPLAPSYSASKAGISRYWENLGLAFEKEKKKIKISNIRFGFVDTKMAKSPVKPMLISTEKAASFIYSIVEKPRIRATKPRRMAAIIWLITLPTRIRFCLS